MITISTPKLFRNILKWCVLYNYDFQTILCMSDTEFYAWFEHVTKQVSDEVQFKLDTGMSLGDWEEKLGL